MTLGLALLILGLAYLAVVLTVSRRKASQVHSAEDYFLAGRQLGPWRVAVSFVAACFGAGSTLGVLKGMPVEGLKILWAVPLPLIATCLALRFWVGSRVNACRGWTLPEAVEQAYGQGTRGVLSVVLWLACTTFVASQGLAAQKLLMALFPNAWPWAFGVGLAALLAYVTLGGFVSVVFTDAAQLVCYGASLTLLAVGVVGAWLAQPDALNHLQAAPAEVLGPALSGFWSLATSPVEWAHRLLTVTSLVAAWVIAPEMWQRLTAARDIPATHRGMTRATLLLVGLYGLVTLIGLGLCSLSSPAALAKGELTPLLQLVTQFPSVWLSALALLGFLVALSSTMDSTLNVAAQTLTVDLYQRYLNPQASQERLLWVSRLSTVATGLVAVGVAFQLQDILPALWLSADIYASAMFVPVVLLLACWQPQAGQRLGPRVRRAGRVALGVGIGSFLLLKAAMTWGWLPLLWQHAITFVSPGLVALLLSGLAAMLAGGLRQPVEKPEPLLARQ
jgi:solute:Na+ symporter, SSS family